MRRMRICYKTRVPIRCTTQFVFVWFCIIFFITRENGTNRVDADAVDEIDDCEGQVESGARFTTLCLITFCNIWTARTTKQY
jgi:hypothetical protein